MELCIQLGISFPFFFAFPFSSFQEVKSEGEKERYNDLIAEFQSIARRDKKAFLSDQCKEIEENNRMGKTRDLFKKIRHIKGIISCKDGHSKDLTEAEDIKKRWQEYTEDYTFDCINHNKLWKILKEMGTPDHPTCLLRKLYAGQDTTV